MATQTVLRFSYSDYAVILNNSVTTIMATYPNNTVDFSPLFDSLDNLMKSAAIIDSARDDTVRRLNEGDGACNLSPIRYVKFFQKLLNYSIELK
jgi:hypothetical protein